MTTLKKWLNSPYVIAILLAFFALLDLFLAGLRAELTKSDWGTWVGSVGTVATLIGTIVLATESERRREREQLDLAIIAGTSLLTKLLDLLIAIWVAENSLPGATASSLDIQAGLKKGLDAIEGVDIWTREDLIPLVQMPEHAAARLAALGMNFQSLFRTIRRASENQTVTAEELVGIQALFQSDLRDYRLQFEPLKNEVSKFLNDHGFGSS